MGSRSITFIMAIMVFVLGILAVAANMMEIPEALLETERMAFSLCDSDRMVGLTWREVAKCEERFAELIKEQGVEIPSKEDFDAADLNGDGTLMFDEWKQWVKLKIRRVFNYIR